MTLSITKIGIVGSGRIGLQLAFLMCMHKFEVTLFSRNSDAAKLKFIAKYSQRYSESDFNDLVQTLIFTEDLEALSDTQLIFECVKEDLVVKRKLIRNLLSRTNSLISSCTSSFKLQDLNKGIDIDGRVNIIHFSNPVVAMKAVEVVYFQTIGHRVFQVPDLNGFVINSIMFQMLHKSVLLHVDNLVPINDIDSLMKLGCGFPMGPFEIIKLIGPETALLIFKNLNLYLSLEAIQFLEKLGER
jgi:3-hydroxybutyryl-CoA dehydrogenase